MTTQTTLTRKQAISKILELFNKNVRGERPDISSYNAGHDGKDGHWLETRMGIAHNASNTPDLLGFEMKNHTQSKTTFGDWSPSTAIFKGKNKLITRTDFLLFFGAPNLEKGNRYSWSGKPCPKVGKYNIFGQRLEVDEENNIHAVYSYSQDQRTNKHEVVPVFLQQENLILATWSSELMKKRVEKKFNNFGWFKCIKEDGVYTKIMFGSPITFEKWIEDVKRGIIFLDSGMYLDTVKPNTRPYANWRANNNYWLALPIETY